MDTIFDNIIESQDTLEDVLDGITTKYLQEYYALFIGSMGYWNFITIEQNLAAKLHVIILNSEIANPDILLDKINEYLINKAIDNELAEL